MCENLDVKKDSNLKPKVYTKKRRDIPSDLECPFAFLFFIISLKTMLKIIFRKDIRWSYKAD